MPEIVTERLALMSNYRSGVGCGSTHMHCPYPAEYRLTMTCCGHSMTLCHAHEWLVGVAFRRMWYDDGILQCPHCKHHWERPRQDWDTVLQVRSLSFSDAG